MSGKVFLDTNILVYAIESGGLEPAKFETAASLVRQSDVCISTQVLGEFYYAVTKPRRASPLTHEEAVAWIEFWKGHEVRTITVPHVNLALEFVARFHIGYYDALILAAARLAGCTRVYSEDLNAGQDYDGVPVEDPFIT